MCTTYGSLNNEKKWKQIGSLVVQNAYIYIYIYTHTPNF